MSTSFAVATVIRWSSIGVNRHGRTSSAALEVLVTGIVDCNCHLLAYTVDNSIGDMIFPVRQVAELNRQVIFLVPFK